MPSTTLLSFPAALGCGGSRPPMPFTDVRWNDRIWAGGGSIASVGRYRRKPLDIDPVEARPDAFDENPPAGMNALLGENIERPHAAIIHLKDRPPFGDEHQPLQPVARAYLSVHLSHDGLTRLAALRRKIDDHR